MLKNIVWIENYYWRQLENACRSVLETVSVRKSLRAQPSETIPSGHMRTAVAQIRLRIRAVWSGPPLSANRIFGYNRMFQWKANAWMWLRAYERWCESARFAHFRKHLFRLTRPTLWIRAMCFWNAFNLKPKICFERWYIGFSALGLASMPICHVQFTDFAVNEKAFRNMFLTAWSHI